MHRAPPSPTFSLATTLQYALLALLAYVFAGAPLLETLSSARSGGGGGKAREAAVGSGSDSHSHSRTLEGLIFPDEALECGDHAFRGVHVLSRDPLVVYIEGFLAAEEADEVVAVSTPLLRPSTTWSSGAETLNPAIRLSSKAPLPLTPTIACLERRARAFQGWRPNVYTETMWAQRYGPGGHYTYHFDWASVSARHGRVSSFLVWARANCTGGGTHFPRLKAPGEGRGEWCRFLECGGEGEGRDGMGQGQGGGEFQGEREGVTFKPIQGNAVFWENVRADGQGVEESLHAGLPVLSGEKVGLNIWSWMAEGVVVPPRSNDGGAISEER